MTSMGELLVSKFAGQSSAHQASVALEQLQTHETAIYAWAVLCKDSENRISVSNRKEYREKPAAVAALIGGLAGFAAGGSFGAIAGAISSGAVAVSADSIQRQINLNLLHKIANEIARDTAVLIAEVAPGEIGSFETLIEHCGGTIVHLTE